MISIEQRLIAPDVTVLSVSGKIIAGHASFELASKVDELMQSSVRRVVFDLSAADYLDSSGLGIIVMYGQNLKKAGGQLFIAGPSGPVAHTLTLCKVAEVIPIFATLEQATTSFGKAAGVV